MQTILEQVKQIISDASEQDIRQVLDFLRKRFPIHQLERDFGVSAEVILEAIHRSSDLTRRGVRGMIAEAVFEREIVPQAIAGGFTRIQNETDSADFTFFNGRKSARLQVKLQRKQRQMAMKYNSKQVEKYQNHFVVEVQKTRNGKDQEGKNTRPYRFSDFDIIAVCMEPCTGDWREFRYSLANDLLARDDEKSLIQVLQPVSLTKNEQWSPSIGDILQKYYTIVST